MTGLKSGFRLDIYLAKNLPISYTRALAFDKQKRYKRSTMQIKETKKELRISVTANDATALRASANSILRNIQVIEATAIK